MIAATDRFVDNWPGQAYNPLTIEKNVPGFNITH